MNAQPKKTVGAGELGALSHGELEENQVTALLISLLQSLWGSSLLGDLWSGSTFPRPSLSEIPRHPCSLGWRDTSCIGSLGYDLGGVRDRGFWQCWLRGPAARQHHHRAHAGCSGPCCTLCSIHAQGCRDSLFLRLSLVSARQKKCLTLPDQDSAGNKTQSTF